MPYSSLVPIATECSRWTVRCPAAKWPVRIVVASSFCRPPAVQRRHSPPIPKHRASSNRSLLRPLPRLSLNSRTSNRFTRLAPKPRSVRRFRSKPSRHQARGNRSGPYQSSRRRRSNRSVGQVSNSRRRPFRRRLPPCPPSSRPAPARAPQNRRRQLPNPRRLSRPVPRPARDRYRCPPLYRFQPDRHRLRHRRRSDLPPASNPGVRPAEANLS